MLNDFLSLIYPKICCACNKTLYKHEDCICMQCRVHLPRTKFEHESQNFVEKLFWGKLNIEAATAHYFYHKNSTIQQLLYQLKYRNTPAIGSALGQFIGDDLKTNPRFKHLDMIIPIPLHKKKLKKRGYNQALLIAEGLGEKMNIEVNKDILYRSINTSTQTKKTAFDRWKNVHSIFDIQNPNQLENKHVLIVDDVITTGSTLQAAAFECLQIPNVKVSVATAAVAWH